jgi:ribosomal protein S18 acetylase RimI-like enzyme
VSEIVIRAMGEDDIQAVSNLVCAGYKWLATNEGYSSVELSRLYQERGSYEAISAQARECDFYLAERDGTILGMVSINKTTIEKLYVHPEHHGQGIGKELFNFAQKHIAEEGYEKISLGAFHASAGFYLAMGMTCVGEKTTGGGPIRGRKILLFEKKL